MTQEDQMDKTEQQAMEYVRDIKGFYSHAIKYVVVISLLFVINFATDARCLGLVAHAGLGHRPAVAWLGRV